MQGAYPDLRAYLKHLKAMDDLRVIDVEVDPDLELAEIHRRVIATGGPALLFRNVSGSSFRVCSNLFGTLQRVRWALGSRTEDVLAQIAAAPHTLIPPTPKRLWQHRGLLKSLAKVGLKRRSRGPVLAKTQVPPRLSSIPMTKSWIKDGGAFLTLPMVYTEHPETGEHNLGIYRIQRYDDATTGIHWQIGKGGGFHHAAAEERGEALPVVINLGGSPAALLGALAPLPENVPELLLSSLALGNRVPMVRHDHGPLPALADAEFALIGEVPALERRPEGPFGDHYGYYSLEHPFPVFHCKAVLHRPDAILPATVVGKPRQEDFFLGDYLQELLSPLFPLAMPGVRDLWSYGETGYHSLSAAVVHERYKREAMVSAFRILGEGQLSLTKFLLVLSQPVDLRDFRVVLQHVLERADFRTDLYTLGNLSMDTLDYAGPALNEGSKGILLGIGDPIRDLPGVFEQQGDLPGQVKDVRVFCKGCLVVETTPYEDHDGVPDAVARCAAFAPWPLIVLCDDARQATASSMNFLWCTFTRFNPSSDLHSKKVELHFNHPAHQAPLVIDARMKKTYPEELFCDDETREKVTRRWEEYFPDGLEMGDSDRGHLD